MKALAKLFYTASFLFITVFLFYTLIEMKNTQNQLQLTDNELEKNLETLVGKLQQEVFSEKIKYILQWTKPNNVPFVYMGKGRQGFIDRKCKYTNCFVTSDRNYLGDVSKFDVIAFAGPEVAYMSYNQLKPEKRAPHQKYAFTNIESADNYPVCSDEVNNFFNWTWTYRLDSETKWGYIIVRDAENNIIGPRTHMNWIKLEEMDPLRDVELRMTLRDKKKAAAWFVSNCRSRSGREHFVTKLQAALDSYNLKIDIYGRCGPYECNRNNEEVCFQIIKKDYYFYLSFENSFSEDYVTEKLLHGLKYNAIPIVYGGANYTRFMPDGIYLNARELGPEKLAKKMKYLIDNPEAYEDYFRWTNHYSYYRRAENALTDDYCGFCQLLNNEEMVKKTSIYKNFKEWWNDPGRC